MATRKQRAAQIDPKITVEGENALLGYEILRDLMGRPRSRGSSRREWLFSATRTPGIVVLDDTVTDVKAEVRGPKGMECLDVTNSEIETETNDADPILGIWLRDASDQRIVGVVPPLDPIASEPDTYEARRVQVYSATREPGVVTLPVTVAQVYAELHGREVETLDVRRREIRPEKTTDADPIIGIWLRNASDDEIVGVVLPLESLTPPASH